MVEHVLNLAQIFDSTLFAFTCPEIYISQIIFFPQLQNVRASFCLIYTQCLCKPMENLLVNKSNSDFGKILQSILEKSQILITYLNLKERYGIF